MPWFFFGSLMDPDILQLVLGRPLSDDDIRPAELPGYRAVRVSEESYPAAVACDQARLLGILVDNISAQEVERICYYESAEFDPEHRWVHPSDDQPPVEASMFIASEEIDLTDETWQLTHWQRDSKAYYLDMTREWMAGFGRYSIAEMEARWQQQNPLMGSSAE